MKRLFKVALIAGSMLFTAGLAQAQKIGYVATADLMQSMPEMKTIQASMNTYQKSFMDQLQQMNTTYQTQGQAYEKNRATMTDAARTAAEADLQSMQQRMQEFQNTASQQVQAKSAELLKPVQEKVRGAIQAVAKEKGYGYVLDSSSTELIVAPEADNMQAAVRARLGLSASAATAAK